MQVRFIDKDGKVVYEGLIKPGARKFGLHHDVVKRRALNGQTYKGFSFEVVEEPVETETEKEVKYYKEKLETILLYGNTISCKRDIKPLLDFLERNGIEAEATWQPKSDGIKGGWLIETDRRSKSVQK